MILYGLVIICGLLTMNGCDNENNRDLRSNISPTLMEVKKRGYLNCGVNTGLPGFADINDNCEWVGFDVDFGRAVAVAIFGDSKKVEFFPTTGKSRFLSLASGEVDMLARNTSWTFNRDVNKFCDFVGVNYYDGQGFMVRSSLGISSVTELDGLKICFHTGTTTGKNLADLARSIKINYIQIPVETHSEAKEKLFSGECDVYTTDTSGLKSTISNASNPDDWVVLQEIISKEPLGPLVRHGDDKWGDIVRWCLNAMIIAEELGITSQNVDSSKLSNNPEILRLLGVEVDYGEKLGLDNKWAYNIIKQVGNYREVFEKHLGENTQLKIQRGLNNLWTKGGLLYAPPCR